MIDTDEVPNFSETHYDELECQTEFNLFYISLNKLQEFLNNAIEDKTLDGNIGREMLLVLDEYESLYGGNK